VTANRRIVPRTVGSKNATDDRAAAGTLKFALPSAFLISFSVLGFEVALTRVFSVMLNYHFVFAVVSAAMLGLGIGGLLFRRFGRATPQSAIQRGALILAISLAGSVALILALPIYASPQLAGIRLWLYLAIAIVPFGAAGFTLSGLFQQFSGKSSLLYGADLLGAAASALAVVPAMDRLGAVNVIFLSAAVAAVAATLVGLPRRGPALRGLGALIALVAVFAALVVTGADFKVPVTNDPSKDLFALVSDPTNEAKIVESRWSSFGRTDLVQSALFPNQMWLFVDGAAGSAMYDLDKILNDPQGKMELTQHFAGSFPFPLLKEGEKGSALVIGPGGGRDVVAALLGGVKDITAVEVNPDLVGIVREYKDYSGAIYSGRPGITSVIAEGRNYVRKTDKTFDLIMLSIPVTKSSRSVEGYALTENNLFTVEAFGDYLDHLTANGRIIIVGHSDVEILKLVSIAVGTFGKRGVSEAEAMKHLYTVGSDMMPAIVIKKEPVSVDEANAVHTRLHELAFDKGVLFVPWIEQQTKGSAIMFSQFLVNVSEGSRSMGDLSRLTTLELKPATDDRPFFYKTARGLPSPFGIFAILMGISVLAIIVLVSLPRKNTPDPRSFVGALRKSPTLKAYLLLFFALGIGYMLIEIAFFQKLTLYLGQPQRALTVLLFSLLLGGGIGSLLTSLLRRAAPRGGAALSVGVALLVAVLVFVFAKVFEIGVDPRIASTIVILPLGILMGCPFPLAVRALNAHGFKSHTAVMWGVNGVASVFGSALAMIVGISWGFSRALFIGIAIYLAIAALFIILARTKPAGLISKEGGRA
jgi:spermidine synthase